MKFGAIHGLRGIAAMAVVFYHLSGNLKAELDELLPDMLSLIFSYGYLGVPVFFVISGFVISYSISSDRVTGRYLGNFVLRRSIRLDITYWASIALAVFLIFLKNSVTGSNESLPSFMDVFFHLFYLQDLVGVDSVISVVYWTLCLEVQLYLFFIFLLWFSQKLSYYRFASVFLTLSLVLGVYSILLDLGVAEGYVDGLFISSWHYFLMGVLASNVVQGVRNSEYVFNAWLIFEFILQLVLGFKVYALSGMFCSILIYLMWNFNVLDRFFTSRLLVYFGTISYTLYLLHPDIGWKVMSFGKLMLGGVVSPLQAGVLLLLGILSSIVAAHIFHVLFERPTQKLAARVKHEPLLAIIHQYTFRGKQA